MNNPFCSFLIKLNKSIVREAVSREVNLYKFTLNTYFLKGLWNMDLGIHLILHSI